MTTCWAVRETGELQQELFGGGSNWAGSGGLEFAEARRHGGRGGTEQEPEWGWVQGGTRIQAPARAALASKSGRLLQFCTPGGLTCPTSSQPWAGKGSWWLEQRKWMSSDREAKKSTGGLNLVVTWFPQWFTPGEETLFKIRLLLRLALKKVLWERREGKQAADAFRGQNPEWGLEGRS